MPSLKATDGGAAYSITQELDNATVLVTGASGYLGSLLVEQLLRTTDVKRIYVLMRGKAGCTARERLTRLLNSGLFHLVRDDLGLQDKVHMLEGDLVSDDLGLSQGDQIKVLSEVQVVFHCAASIELEADIQDTLSSNYLGTRRLLLLATQMQRLRCFLHVSTAFVNANQPRGSMIEERLYPLKLGAGEASHAEVVEELMFLNPEDANVRARMLMDLWDFPNTYTLGKHLTEQQVCDYHNQGLPVAIVRPSLVGGVAGAPYPGYSGNLAGPVGLALAMAIGMFDCVDSVALVPTHVWDAVPSDVVTSAILAAAAAVCAGLDFTCMGAAGSSSADPFIIHAGTSCTYPISFAESQHTAYAFMQNNPPPFRLPGAVLFKVPVDYRPNERAVQWRKTMVAWKVWLCVKALTLLGQHKAAKKLTYGHMCWAVQNATKTDRNLIFDASNLKTLAARLNPTDAASGHFTITWTLKSSKAMGGWPRHTATCLAGMYRKVFGITALKHVQHDFRFIPHKTPGVQAAAAAVTGQHKLRSDTISDADPLSAAAAVPAGVQLKATQGMGASVLNVTARTSSAGGNHGLPSIDSTLGGSEQLAADTPHLVSLTDINSSDQARCKAPAGSHRSEKQ